MKNDMQKLEMSVGRIDECHFKRHDGMCVLNITVLLSVRMDIDKSTVDSRGYSP
jgi:hypothetical protein